MLIAESMISLPRVNWHLNNTAPLCTPPSKSSTWPCIQDGSSKAESAFGLAEAQINLGKLQNELSAKISETAKYDSELQQYKDLFQSAEDDSNSGQNELLQLIGKVNELEIRLKGNNAKVQGHDGSTTDISLSKGHMLRFSLRRMRHVSLTKSLVRLGESSTRRLRDDGDPFDFPDPEDDEESDVDDWGNEEGEEDENDANVRTYAASDCGWTITERRTREQDTVKVPAFPTLPSLTQWRIQIAKNLVTASGRLDLHEITWWGEIGLAENNFETLADAGERRFLGLDLKLSTALGSMLKQVILLLRM